MLARRVSPATASSTSCSAPSMRCGPLRTRSMTVARRQLAGAPCTESGLFRPAAVASPTRQHAHQSWICKASGRRESVFMFGGLFGGYKNKDDFDDDDGFGGDEDFTVFKLQVGVFGDIRRWQTKLDDIATKYDSDDAEQLHGIFTDALMFILRNTEYVGYTASGGKVFDDLDRAEQKFNSVLLEERLKFKEETLVNVDGRRKARTLEEKGGGDGLDRWLCMTLLMCVEGRVKIPPIDSISELKKVLTKLGGMTCDDLVAFELLWTPQDEGDFYSKDELLTDYPTLRTLT